MATDTRTDLYNDPRIKVVDCEGVIGAGKSTLISQLADSLGGATCHVIHLEEPITLWEKSGMFAAFCESPVLMAFAFQLYVIATRIGAFARGYRRALDHLAANPGQHVIIITERSPWGDRLFKRVMVKSGFFTAVQDVAYEQGFTEWQATVYQRRPDLVLWLRTPPAVALGRIDDRKRPNEDVSPEYMAMLHAEHSDALSGGTFEGAPVLVVDGANEFRKDKDPTFAKKVASDVRRMLAVTQ